MSKKPAEILLGIVLSIAGWNLIETISIGKQLTALVTQVAINTRQINRISEKIYVNVSVTNSFAGK